jgi:CubicO group peptidase (beta-lactamase class C family)
MYPEVASPSSSAAFIAAKTAIQDEITQALAGGQLDNGTAFGIQVFSRQSDKTLYEHYHGPIGPETLVRVASISKLMTVYTTLAALGDKHWNDPVTKHIPELARPKARNPVYDVDWSEVTLGALASHMGGIPRDCTSRTLLDTAAANSRRCPRRPRPVHPRGAPWAANVERLGKDPVRHRRTQAMHERG